MHILYFHQHFSTPSGSTGTRSYEMARALIERDHEVTMVCGSYGGGHTGLSGEPVNGIRNGEVDGIRVIEICLPYSNHDSLAKRSITFLRFAVKSIHIARRTRYDLLFATSTPLTAGIPGIVMRVLKPRKPFVFEVRDLWPELPREMGVITNRPMLWSMSVLEWLSYNSARSCIGLSPGIAEGIKRRCSKKKAVAMIPNGCDLELFKVSTAPQSNDGVPAVKVATASRRSQQFETNQQGRRDADPTLQSNDGVSPSLVGGDADPTLRTFRAVFTGAHGMANGLDAVLDAAAVLKQRGRNDIELVFVGDGKLKPQLMERADREGLSNCTFCDPIPKLELADKIRDFDAGLMILDNVPAFYYGTSPNKFFDYIASGLPVLNNYPGWLAQMIKEHGCGIAVPPEDPQAFADALEKLADSADARRQMSTHARQLAESQFSRRRLSGEFVQFLESTGKKREA